MIRILHTADWHLGQTFFGYDRVEEHTHFLQWLVRELKENKIDVLLIAGDIFDVSNPSAASQHMFYRFIRQVTEENPKLQLVVVAGNHDSAARLEAPLPLLQEMRTEIRGIVRRHEGEIDYDHLIVELKNSEGEVEALCLAVPFLRQGDYPVVTTDGNPYAEGVKELYARLQERALQRRKDGQALVAVGHLQATGSEIAERDFSERTIIGWLECVSPDAFTEQIAYTALGHIHSPQNVGKGMVRYCGTPLKYSFSETDQEKTITVVEMEEKGMLKIRLLPLKPFRDMRKLRGTYMELTARSFYRDMNCEDYIQVTLTDEDDVPDGLQKLRVIYPNIMQLLYDNQRTRASSQIDAVQDVEEKTELELFREFYELQNNQPMMKQQEEFAEKLIREIKE